MTVNSVHSIALWRWNLKSASAGKETEDLDEEDEELCGICRVAFDGCCPDCKTPGDECPLSQ